MSIIVSFIYIYVLYAKAIYSISMLYTTAHLSAWETWTLTWFLLRNKCSSRRNRQNFANFVLFYLESSDGIVRLQN